MRKKIKEVLVLNSNPWRILPAFRVSKRTANNIRSDHPAPDRFRLVYFLFLFLAGTPALAHPAHETNAEMVWNSKTKSLEVALQMRGIDLEAALTKEGAKKVDLDTTPEVDDRIRQYIETVFTVQTKAGQPVRSKYAGKKIEERTVWLYFEFPLGSETPFGSAVTNRFLFGVLENQTNKVALRVGDLRDSMTFDKQHPTRKLLARETPAASTWKPPINLESLPPVRDLPDLFTLSDGTRVTSVEQWQQRRAEIKQIVQYFAYGHLPPRPDVITATVKETKNLAKHPNATRQLIRLTIGSKAKLSLDISIHRPNSKQPCPVIVMPVHRITELPCLPLVLENGYSLVQFQRDNLDPDQADIVGPAQSAYPDSDWGTLAVWAWGAMRVVDYLESRRDLDEDRIVVTGHSRDGKVALLAGALDERFALVAPNGSGCGGAGCFRNTDATSESLEQITDPKRFGYWFHPRLRWFAGREDRLPFDQHFLKALVAPRPLLCTEARGDIWANPLGTRRTSMAARDVYSFLDAKNKIGLTYRDGKHDQTLEDWNALLEFSNWHFFAKSPTNEAVFWQRP